MEWHNHSVPRQIPDVWEGCKQEQGRIYSGETRKSLDVVQLLSCVRLFATQWTVAHQASLSFTVSEFAETHVHWVSDAIQTSHPLWPPSPPALNLPQHQGLFRWVGSSYQVAKVLELQLQHQSFQCWFPLGLIGLIFLLSKGLSRIFSRTTVQKKEPYLSAYIPGSMWGLGHRQLSLMRAPGKVKATWTCKLHTVWIVPQPTHRSMGKGWKTLLAKDILE